MSTTRDTLSQLMEDVRRRGGPWSSAQNPGAEPAVATAAWMASEDPIAMLLLLAAIDPHRNEPACDALVASMSFFSPMSRERERQARSRPGMTHDGPDRFRFLHLAQRMRTALSGTTAADRSTLLPKLCAAIRTVVTDPYTLAG